MVHTPLITGSKGRLGRAICQIIEEEFDDELPGAVFATRDELDLTDYFRLRSELERIRPTVVVNCAAFADVDGCEKMKDRARMVNTDGARNIARAARCVGARVIQLSTDLVFDGSEKKPYREEDRTSPLSHYAATKLEGEDAVRDENPEHVILRSSWFFSPWPSNLYPEVFLRSLQEGKPLRMVSDRIGSPTYLRDLARAIVHVIMTPYTGVLHFANLGEPTSRFHVLRALAEKLGIDTAGLTPISNEDWTGDAASRPPYSALDPTRYTEVTGLRPRRWIDCLQEYAEERVACGSC